MAWGTFARERFEVVSGQLTEHRSSPDVLRGHCASCGTSLTYQHDKRSAEIDVTLATLDRADSLAPQAHIWVQDKLPWESLDDGLAQYPTVSDGDAVPTSPTLRPGYRSLTPRIVAPDAAGLVAFLQQVFGARGEYNASHPTHMHIGDASVLISDVDEREAMPAFLYAYVADVDACYQRALNAGARSVEAPRLVPYGDYRFMIEDRWGNTWQVAKFVR